MGFFLISGNLGDISKSCQDQLWCKKKKKKWQKVKYSIIQSVSAAEKDIGLKEIYLVNQFSPACQCWPVRRCGPCWRLCTCPHGGAPGRRRRPPRAAPSPCAGPEAGSCLEGETWADGRSPRPTFEPSRASAGAHPAASGCRWCRRRTPPGGGNMPPPVHGTDVVRI